MVFSLRYVATILFNLLRLKVILFILISSLINNLNRLTTCCFSVSVTGLVFLTFTFTLVSKIGFLICWDFTSTVTFLLVSTSKSLSHGVKYVSSAITSKRILPFVFSSINPFNFLIGISHFPLELIVPLNKSEYSDFSTTYLALDLFRLAPCNLISHSNNSVLSVNNLYIRYLFIINIK